MLEIWLLMFGCYYFEDFRGTWVNVRLENRVLFNWIAIDKLGLHIQQAMISCSNGFALDIFRAEIAIYIQC
ncbi:hypothetical protein HanHA89_Chr15g0603691 [Helianthus annuus]|nr:hypothetical protein HanHA89_Chr15g0603691 [Helianthus annuus]